MEAINPGVFCGGENGAKEDCFGRSEEVIICTFAVVINNEGCIDISLDRFPMSSKTVQTSRTPFLNRKS